MTESQIELARKLVAAPRWEWRAGMRGIDTKASAFLVVAGHHSGGAIVAAGPMTLLPFSRSAMGMCLPDLTDDATAGILLGMLPRGVSIIDHHEGEDCPDGWEIGLLGAAPTSIRESLVWGFNTIGEGATRGEAAARALLAVWGER